VDTHLVEIHPRPRGREVTQGGYMFGDLDLTELPVDRILIGLASAGGAVPAHGQECKAVLVVVAEGDGFQTTGRRVDHGGGGGQREQAEGTDHVVSSSGWAAMPSRKRSR